MPAQESAASPLAVASHPVEGSKGVESFNGKFGTVAPSNFDAKFAFTCSWLNSLRKLTLTEPNGEFFRSGECDWPLAFTQLLEFVGLAVAGVTRGRLDQEPSQSGRGLEVLKAENAVEMCRGLKVP